MTPENDHLRSQFLSQFGTIVIEDSFALAFVSLEALTAGNLSTGPFRIRFTDRVSQHLTVSRNSGQTVLNLLGLEHIQKIYIPQRTGIAT
jgi:hypothetical protein